MTWPNDASGVSSRMDCDVKTKLHTVLLCNSVKDTASLTNTCLPRPEMDSSRMGGDIYLPLAMLDLNWWPSHESPGSPSNPPSHFPNKHSANFCLLIWRTVQLSRAPALLLVLICAKISRERIHSRDELIKCQFVEEMTPVIFWVHK